MFTSLTAAALYLAAGSPRTVQAASLTGNRAATLKNAKTRKKAAVANNKVARKTSKVKTGSAVAAEANNENKQSQQPDQGSSDSVTVTAHYVDQDGKMIVADALLTGKSGDSYPDKTIAGYVLVNKSSDKYAAGVTTVTYRYTNQVTVTAHYINQKDEQVAPDKQLMGVPVPDQGTYDWRGLQVSHYKSSGLAIIFGGTVKDPGPLINTLRRAGVVREIDITGPLVVTSKADDIFASLDNLTEIKGLERLNTARVTSMSNMFAGCSSLTSLDVSKFDTSQVTNMQNMFAGCSSLTSLDISSLKMTSSITRDGMLNNLTKLNTLILGKDNIISGNGLNNPGIWLNVGKGTQDKPEGNKKWTSSQLMANYNGTDDHDTYVRFSEVTVHYRDEANNQLLPDEILTGKVGNSYESKPKEIPGYVLKSNPTDASGTFTDDAKEVTYVYAKAAAPSPEQTDQGAAVTVHYQDAKGNTLASDEVLTGKVGTGYVSTAKTIEGYKLVIRPGNATGFFSQNPQSVTYIYAPEESENGKQPEQNGSGSGNNSQNQTTHHSKSEHSDNNQTQTGNRGQGHKATATEKKATKETESGKQLPQTGSAGRERELALMLGSLSVLSILIGGWINRRKKKD